MTPPAGAAAGTDPGTGPATATPAGSGRRLAGEAPTGGGVSPVVGAAGADAPGVSSAGPAPQQWAAAVETLQGLPRDARVLLICHINPDGDALGSMLGFALGLRALGFTRVQATFPGPMELPEAYAAMPGRELLVPADEVFTDPELVCCFDAASVSRLGALADRLERAPSIVLDHHASNSGFGTVPLVIPGAAATSVVVEILLDRLGVPLDAAIAECLYIALVTDTGSFRFDSTTPAVHQLAARLLATGIAPAEISRRIFETRPYGAVRLHAEVLSRTRLEPAAARGRGLVWTYATLDDLARHGQRPYVLESLIDPVRATAEADVSCVLKQALPGEWAVSLRSKGAVDVSRVAIALGGGGHRLAAGFTAYGTVDEVLARVRAALDQE